MTHVSVDRRTTNTVLVLQSVSDVSGYKETTKLLLHPADKKKKKKK